jgi:MarR family transcriptional regulator, transcriptional regulator for hemolysin
MGKTAMDEFQFGEGIEFLILCTAQLYSRMLNAALAPYGITLRQAQVIFWLAYEGKPLPQQGLATRMHLEPPTLVGILDRMERDGWISRQDCPGDRRKKMIQLEPQVESIWRKIVAAALSVRAQATKGFGPGDLERFKKLLSTFDLNMLTTVPNLALPIGDQIKGADVQGRAAAGG